MGKSADRIITGSVPFQPAILFHDDGRIHQWLCRTQGCRYLAESWFEDDGETRSPLQLTILPGNHSGIDAATARVGL